MKYHFTSTRMAIIKETDNFCQWEGGEIETPCKAGEMWNGEMMQMLWKTV